MARRYGATNPPCGSALPGMHDVWLLSAKRALSKRRIMSEQRDQFVHRHVGLSQDASQRPALYVAGMIRHDDTQHGRSECFRTWWLPLT